MANLENGFYEEHAVKVDGQKLSEKFSVSYTPEGSTPDGYQVYESLAIQTKRGSIEINRDGSAVYMSGGNETERSMTEAYTMIGIDTSSKEFKDFQQKIQQPEYYNENTVNSMLETTPQLSAEKQIERLNDFSKQATNEMAEHEQARQDNWLGNEYVEQLSDKGFSKERLAEMSADITNASYGATYEEISQELVDEINQELKANGHDEILIKGSMADNYRNSLESDSRITNAELNQLQKEAELSAFDNDLNYNSSTAQKSFDNSITERTKQMNIEQAELAQPGRTYTGNVLSVDEDVTIQKTKSGKLVVHQTENLPGIKENDTGSSFQIRYGADGKGDIAEKANDLEIGKQKELESKHANDGMTM